MVYHVSRQAYVLTWWKRRINECLSPPFERNESCEDHRPSVAGILIGIWELVGVFSSRGELYCHPRFSFYDGAASFF